SSMLSSFRDGFHWDERALLSNWKYPVVSGISYVILLFAVQYIMRDKKPMKLKWPYALHNGALSLFSLAILIGQGYETFLHWQKTSMFEVFCWQAEGPPNGRLFFWSYLFYLSKYYELLDTIFLVLKKKPLDFLHCYHHAIVPFSAWLGFQGWYMPIITGCLFNSAVHVVMYFYYMMATLGKTVWWKKYLTVFQIIQFCSGGFFTLSFYYFYFQDIAGLEID
ncbi:hypothetical protein GUITHDRAFT_67434, partial [Guillardia theta CCMP2712]